MNERGVFDLRLHVEGIDELDVWERVTAFQRAAAALEVPGVAVRYVQLRPPRRSRTFEATMAPTPKRKRAA